jgi:hypothetical protein
VDCGWGHASAPFHQWREDAAIAFGKDYVSHRNLTEDVSHGANAM